MGFFDDFFDQWEENINDERTAYEAAKNTHDAIYDTVEKTKSVGGKYLSGVGFDEIREANAYKDLKSSQIFSTIKFCFICILLVILYYIFYDKVNIVFDKVVELAVNVFKHIIGWLPF